MARATAVANDLLPAGYEVMETARLGVRGGRCEHGLDGGTDRGGVGVTDRAGPGAHPQSGGEGMDLRPVERDGVLDEEGERRAVRTGLPVEGAAVVAAGLAAGRRRRGRGGAVTDPQGGRARDAGLVVDPAGWAGGYGRPVKGLGQREAVAVEYAPDSRVRGASSGGAGYATTRRSRPEGTGGVSPRGEAGPDPAGLRR